MRSCVGQNFPCAAAHIAVTDAGSEFVCSGKLMNAMRIFPVATYSFSIMRKVESCHALQNGHWKSLTMTNQSFADSLPAILPRSAASVSESRTEAAEFGVAGLAASLVVAATTVAARAIERRWKRGMVGKRFRVRMTTRYNVPVRARRFARGRGL